MLVRGGEPVADRRSVLPAQGQQAVTPYLQSTPSKAGQSQGRGDCGLGSWWGAGRSLVLLRRAQGVGQGSDRLPGEAGGGTTIGFACAGGRPARTSSRLSIFPEDSPVGLRECCSWWGAGRGRWRTDDRFCLHREAAGQGLTGPAARRLAPAEGGTRVRSARTPSRLSTSTEGIPVGLQTCPFVVADRRSVLIAPASPYLIQTFNSP